MHEDARHLTELSADLGIGLLQASILLVTFINMLWALSSDFVFHVAGRHDRDPRLHGVGGGHLRGLRLVVELLGRTQPDRPQCGALRARGGSALFAGAGERAHRRDCARRRRGGRGAAHRDRSRRVFCSPCAGWSPGLTNLTWVTAGYGWFTLVAPILAAAPLYFAGNLSFGGLMMASGAFIQVQSSLRWFVDNFSTIADWRATLLRVASFRRAVIGTDVLHDVESRIAFVEGEPGTIVIDHLEIASHGGCTRLEEPHVEMKAGERVLIVGEPGTGKTLLFRALAGLWPWGAGRIARPKGETMLCIPRTRVSASRHAARGARLPLDRSRTSLPRRSRMPSSGSASIVSCRCSISPGAGTAELSDGEQQSAGIRAGVAACAAMAAHR